MVGNILKQLRLSRDLNQTEMAKELELSRERYNQYENERRAPDYETLKKIAEYFQVSTDYLLGRTDDPTPVRNLDQDLYDEQGPTKELEALMDDEPLRTEFMDYDEWSEEEKRNLLNFIKGQKALKKINEKK